VGPRVWKTATLAWLAAILIVSLLPGGAATPGGTFWHLLGYGVLGVLWARWQAAWSVWLLGTAYGAAIEGLQYLVPYRQAELSDLLVNAAGMFVGVASARFFVRRSTSR
jgi:VanZ family protein